MNDFEIGASIFGALGVAFLFYNINSPSTTRPAVYQPFSPFKQPDTGPLLRPPPTGRETYKGLESFGGTRRKNKKR